MLTTENYAGGFLVDEELMAGVSAHPEKADVFIAFVIQHTTGEYIGYQPFLDLGAALGAINQIPRRWTYEKLGGCGGCSDGSCGKGGGCGKQGGNCKSARCG